MKSIKELIIQKNHQKVLDSKVYEIELTARISGIKDAYEDILDSALMSCIQDCIQELEDTGAIAELTEEDFTDYKVVFFTKCNL